MDGQKLTRNHSSLLRLSTTVRSSIHSLSSMNEIAPDEEIYNLEERKLHCKPVSPLVRSGSVRLTPILAILFLYVCTLFAFFNTDDIATSENLLLGLILVAVLLFFASKNKSRIQQSFSFCKELCYEYGKKVGFLCLTSKNDEKSVKWFIGESNFDYKENAKNIIREGVEFYSNGDYYEGEFHQGKCNGSGVYNYFTNGRYEGDWIGGKYDGYGVESWSRGSRYRGQYRQGLRHGYGVYKFYTGDTYAGEWCNGQSHGMGVQSCADGSCYIGEFKCGVKHGLGSYHFRNGDRYAGEYFGDKVHGFGVYHFSNGHCYEGSWHEGRKQGYGMYTFRSGETRCGEWDGGKLKASLLPLTDSVLRAVQAARKSAGNAIKLCMVDEQVNKAVMASNRAATAARVAAVKAVQNRIDGKFCDTDV
ncbi:MORN repeat-containing protein 1-like [Olea europaea var. sylvestris]|uniref:MORN repeat-containing protein 1-like n=1 Tax=Olea europaea var. sylvestris TaxID=158386 RepID=UPI000C1CD4B0|nr:MORN repeat-containing protein 1-like [Olea europaea var. sylvestris]XP_022860216.1 MORN repeat-containing protein 1-like [Olea europaea var. sylvestris]